MKLRSFVFAGLICLAFAACQQLPSKEGEYPVANLAPPASPAGGDEAGIPAGDPPKKATLFGPESKPAEADPVGPADPEAASAEPAPEGTAALAETVFPEAAPEEETPPLPPDLLPQPALIPEAALVEQPPEPPPAPEPPPPEPAPPQTVEAPPPAPPPLVQTPPPVPPRPPARPPPVPNFLRPSEPPPPEEPPPEKPLALIPELPARPRPAPAGEEPVFSRTVTVYTGQYIEVPFRGPGWLYLGEIGARRGVYYDSRRIDEEGMVFVFRADEEGTYSLRFNRQDFIRDAVINDYVKVIVQNAPEISGSAWNSTAVTPDRVYAGPRFPPAAPQNPAAGAVELKAEDAAVKAPESPGQNAQTAAARPQNPSQSVQTPPPAGTAPAQTESAARPAGAVSAQPENAAVPPAGSSPSAYLIKAKEEYSAGRIDNALEILDRLRAAYPEGSDEAYWLYAQALEANSSSRDVKQALDYYRRLVREYPQSDRYDAAAKRIAYLERFYFNIR